MAAAPIFPCNVDAFEVDGAYPLADRFRLLGKVTWELRRRYGGIYAPYLPMADKPFVVGFTGKAPERAALPLGVMTVVHQGQMTLRDEPAAREAVRRLLYETGRRSLENAGYWEYFGGIVFPRKPLENRRDNLLIFHGFDFQFDHNDAGIPFSTIDVTAHYARRTSFLEEIRSHAGDLRWFGEEVEARRRQFRAQRRTSKGVYFYYSLRGTSVPVDGYDPRPISKVPLSDEVTVRGQTFSGTVYEFLRTAYADHPLIGTLDPNQPGMTQGKYVYPPQFLHRHLSLEDVPRPILQEHSFLSAPDPSGELNPTNAAAVRRYRRIQDIRNKHFVSLDFGAAALHFRHPIEKERVASDTFPKPYLLVDPHKEPVPPERLKAALAAGGLRPPQISEMFIWAHRTEMMKPLWLAIWQKMNKMFGFSLPEEYTPLDASQDLAAYLGSRSEYDPIKHGSAICILGGSGDEHDRLNTLFGRSGIAVQCLEETTAGIIVEGSGQSILEGICAGIYAKAGGVPWVLHDRLHYDRFVAIDIGRKKSEHWAMGIVADQTGSFVVLPGDQIVGEDLEAAAIQKCTSRAIGAKVPETLIILRDGELPSKSEIQELYAAVEPTPVLNAAIVAVLKGVPQRIFRRTKGQIEKPKSGDYIAMKAGEIAVCCAGVDEYGHGVPKPKVLHVYTVKGKVTPISIAEDFFRMSYLNYGSPGRSYSTAGPLELAHRLAAELSRGVYGSGPPF
jgi:hypothetical protein